MPSMQFIRRLSTARGGNRRADCGRAEVDPLQLLPDLGDPMYFLADRRAPAVELLTE
jgi:hypothetical protein